MSEIESKTRDIIAKGMAQAFPTNPELLDNLDGLIQLLKAKRFSTDDQKREIALAFLTEAEVDTNACETLYHKKIYSRAIFFLQQAVEKAAKGYVLGFGYMDLPEIYTHNTPILLLEASLEKTGIRNWAKQISDQRIGTKIENAYDTLHDKDSRQVISQMTCKEIKQFLTRIKDYEHTAIDLQDWIFQQLCDITGFEKKPVLTESLSDWTVLYGLAAITHTHEAISRYPNEAITPSTSYTKKLGIVREILDITKRLKTTIQSVKGKINAMA